MCRRLLIIILSILCLISSICTAPIEAKQTVVSNRHRPIVMIVADKMDSVEFYESRLPGIRRLIAESACGLMTIRSGSGYTNTNSGYLTLGSGNRSAAPGVLNGAYRLEHMIGDIPAGDLWSWSSEKPDLATGSNLVVPEIGWIFNQAEISERTAIPGLLGNLFRKHGWTTVLIGNIDSADLKNRPAGLLLMDEDGVIDQGNIEENINDYDPKFPYGFRFSQVKVNNELKRHLHQDTLLVVEFGDFARLDAIQPDIDLVQFPRLKSRVWRSFDNFITAFLNQYPPDKVDLILLSPSISKDNWQNKKWMAPVVIRSKEYPAGILTSGTTNWSGLVANLDVVPTLSVLGGVPLTDPVSGRPLSAQIVPDHPGYLSRLHTRINSILTQQRSMIDWYLGLISIGWGIGIIAWLWRKKRFTRWSLLTVAAAPLALMVLPLLPEFSWNVAGFFIVVVLLGIICSRIDPTHNTSLYWMALVTWAVITVDQVTGWHLIRFSALGYSAAAGSRYYGMGNELGGIYLPVALVAAHYFNEKWGSKWPAFIIFGITMVILGWPKYGVDFGGTLSFGLAFLYYGLNLFGISLKNKKLWFISGAGFLAVLGIGFWDALRPPEVQTHIGLFFGLILHANFNEIGLVVMRKLSMNLKLVVFSPWMRIVVMAALIGIIIRFYPKTARLKYDNLLWSSIIVVGIASLLFNDSGVVALGTCLAFGFTYRLLEVERLTSQELTGKADSGG